MAAASVLLGACAAAVETDGYDEESGAEGVGVVRQALVDDSTITVTAANAAQKRQQLIDFIWGSGGFPWSKMPARNLDVTPPIAGLPNLSRVDRLTISMNQNGYTESNTTHHYIPTRSNDRLVILVHGHACSMDDLPADPFSDEGSGLERTLSTLLKEGFSVLTVYMPHMTPTQCADVLHDTMMARTLTQGNPLKWFLEHIAASLNYLQARSSTDDFPQYEDFSMAGLSGGGWTTTLYAAIDPRIRVSLSVAGSIPLYLRSGNSVGDDEQTHEPFYSIAGYPDLYVLGAWGPDRRQVLVLNRRDTCCFGEAHHNAALHGPWEDAMRQVELDVRTRLSEMGGTVGAGFFRLEIDEASLVHQISWNTVLNTIIAELNHGRRVMGGASAATAFVRGLNGNLWRRTTSGWTDTGLAMTGVPAVIQSALHTFDVFYRAPGNQMMHAYSNGSTWMSRSIGGATVTDPVATSSGSTLFVIGMGGGDRHPYLWRIASDNSASVSLVSASAEFIGQPALVSASDGLHLYGTGPDRGVYHLKSNSPTTPTSWSFEAIGGEVAGFPTALRMGSQNLVYVRGVNTGHIWEASQSGSGSWSWTDLSAATSSSVLHVGSPSASISGSNIYVYSRAESGALERFRKVGSTWSLQHTSTNLSGSPLSVSGQAYVRGTSGQLWRWTGSSWISLGGLFY